MSEHEEKTPETKGEEQEFVKLTPEQYEALLDELEKARSKAPDVIDDLVEKAKTSEKPAESIPEQVDFDSMSNAELVNYMMTFAQEHLVKPLMVQLETIRVQNEIDKCREKFSDFDDYYQDIYRICIDNPRIPIEKAYKLAKLENEERKKTPEPTKPVLRTLPPRPVRTHSERTSVPHSTTMQQEPATIKEAALRAWEEIMKKSGG